MKNHQFVNTMVPFLNLIGIETTFQTINHETFLPGITIQGGNLIIDQEKLLYPGDILHEAGHLAVTPPEQRQTMSGEIDQDPGLEMAAIAWSYAAALHLDLDPSIVFHPDGYKGDSESLLTNFTQGHYFGVPLLQWMGMTNEETPDMESGRICYPKMVSWVREE